MRVLLLTPPMTQINTPYPATAYLTGALRAQGIDCRQADPAIDLLLQLLSKKGLESVESELRARFGEDTKAAPRPVRHFLYHAAAYQRTVDSVVRFLQSKDPTLAYRINQEGFLPRGQRFKEVEDESLDYAFGSLGIQDRAQYLASLYIDDLADTLREGIDEHFALSRYAEKLAASSPSFNPIREALEKSPSLIDRTLDAITARLMKEHAPDFVGLTVPFPGNVYGAFRMAKVIRAVSPATKIVMGGGYVNTELRSLSDARVFDYLDYLTFDDGERPLLSLLQGGPLLRTMVRENGAVVWKSDPKLHDIPFRDSATPTYDGLPLHDYLSLCELPNPMHRLWSDGRWNKLTVAHGCYWKKCSFCDVTLDYISRYEPQGAKQLVDRMEQLVHETGQSGFHFVDEAAPPSLLHSMANEILARGLNVSWWANIRFEEAFTPEVAAKLAQSGCIALSGGLEVANDRLLALMKKGVTVEQVARVTHAMGQAGIMVHAYLMFGFPTQTVAETIDSLERVRQLFESGCIQSGFWHRFSATVHSPVGKDPEAFGVVLQPLASTFAQNDVPFLDKTGIDHELLHGGLKKALYNYMHGVGLEEDVRQWFEFPVPKARVPRDFVRSALQKGRKETSQP